jgi:Iap family predicted aminopeptidase
MRIAAVGFFVVMLCAASYGQKVQFAAADRAEILSRVKDAPSTDSERASRIKSWFSEAGCNGNLLHEQTVAGAPSPNVICELGVAGEAIIVGAHYETASAGRPLDNWSAAALLPALYKALRERKRHHRFIFVAFADQGSDLSGSRFFAGHMSPEDLRRTQAMVNLDVLGLSPTKVWTSHSDKDLVHDLVIMVYSLKLPVSQISMERASTTDSEAFASVQVPTITIHSLTEPNLAAATATPFRPSNYYDTYRLLCGYLAYLDITLKPRTN